MNTAHSSFQQHSQRIFALFAVVFSTLTIAQSKKAQAGAFEVGAGFSFSRNQYDSDTDYSSTQRWGLSLGYYFNDLMQIELSYQDSLETTYITDYEDTEFHDRIYSVNWVQGFLKRGFPVQPFVKAGLGQLNRDATGSYANGAVPATQVDSITGILGVGVKVGLLQNLSLKWEGMSYLRGGSIGKWQDNIATNIGLSFMF